MAKKKSLAAAGRRLTAFTLALFLVLSSAFGAAGPVGSAQALDLEECAKDVVTGAWTETVLDYIMGNPNYCLEITESDFAAQTQADMVASMRSYESNVDGTLSALDNRLVDSRSVALTKAKIAVVNELNNGSNKSVATQAGKDAIDEYYANIQVNLMATWDHGIVQSRYVSQTATDTGDDPTTWIDYTGWPDGGAGGAEHQHIEGSNTTHIAELPMANWTDLTGQKHQTRALVVKEVFTSSTSTSWIHPLDLVDIYAIWGDGSAMNDFPDTAEINVTDPEGNQYVVIRETDYTSRMSDIENQSTLAKDNVDAYVDAVYANYSAGELNTSDLLDPTEIYQEASTDRNTTGYYGWASIQLASIGAGGNTEHSHTINTTYNGSNVLWEGTLFYTGDDLGTIESGTTYDPSAYNGAFLMAVQLGENESAIRELKNNFTVVETVDVRTGETIQNTTVEKKVYSTTNASELEYELQQLRELRQEYENQTTFASSGGGGGGGGDGGFNIGFGLGDSAGVVVVIVVLAAIALARS